MKGHTSPSTRTVPQKPSGHLPRFVLRSCRRCRGDLALHRDLWGEEYVCLQCGHGEANPPTPIPSCSSEADKNGAREERLAPDALTKGDHIGHP